MLRSLRPKSIRIRTKVSFKYRLKDYLEGTLDHSVPDARNLERSCFAVTLWNFYRTRRSGLVRPCKKLFSNLAKKLIDSHNFDGLKSLTINTWSPIVPFCNSIGFLQGFHPCDVHKDSPKTMSLIRLRLQIYLLLQFLQI